jgi:hypothetical protein
MPTTCAVPGCHNKQSNDSGISFHKYVITVMRRFLFIPPQCCILAHSTIVCKLNTRFQVYIARSSERDLLPLIQCCSNLAASDVLCGITRNCLAIVHLFLYLFESSKRLHVQQPHRKIVFRFTYVGLEAFLDNGIFYFIRVESVLENINRV